MQAINPATEQPIRDYPDHSTADVESLLEQAAGAFRSWRTTTFAERSRLMKNAASLLRERKDHYARLMTEEMGKPITASESEIDKCALVCDFYAENAEGFLTPQTVKTDADRSFVRFDPLGPVLAIMPWNFPFWQVFRFAAPALMAGNVGLLKHAANVPGTALAIEQLFRDAEFPSGVFATLLIDSETASEIIEHPTIAAVTVTGSERAGRSVGEHAGRSLKKSVLELGGSDPFIVLEDAPIAETAKQAAKARTINSGQSCIAAKRFIVEESIAEQFEKAFVQAMQALSVGDPLDRKTEIGPMARGDLRDSLHDQVERSIQAGAKLLSGGKPLDRKGYFYPPTVLSQVRQGTPAFDEETFGPVAAVIPARDAEHAVELANQSPYGLGASIWTADAKRGERLAAQIDAGCVFVNEIVKSDPRLPFGGVKQSGYGRELGEFGIREFVNVKTVWTKTG